MLLRLLSAALLALGLSSAAQAQVPQVVPTCGAASGLSLPQGPGGRLTVSPDGTLCTTAGAGGGGGGGATGSVTSPGTNGTQAQAIQGINNGVPVPTTTAPQTGSNERDVRSSGALDATSTASAIDIPVNGQASVGLRFSGLAASGATLTFEQSNDGGTTYTGVNEVNAGTGVPSATRTTDGQTRIAVQGRTNLRIRVSTAGTGTISVAWTVSVREGLFTLASPLPPGGNTVGSIANTAFGLTGPIPAGTNVIGAVTQSGGPWAVSGTVTANLGTLNGAATEAKQPAFGTAGSPSTNVLSVQGTAGGTPQPVVATPNSVTGSVTAYTAGTTSAQALAASARRFLAIDNESATATIACSFGGTAALNTAGSFTIPAGATRTWDANFVPSEALNCIASAASTPVTIQAN